MHPPLGSILRPSLAHHVVLIVRQGSSWSLQGIIYVVPEYGKVLGEPGKKPHHIKNLVKPTSWTVFMEQSHTQNFTATHTLRNISA